MSYVQYLFHSSREQRMTWGQIPCSDADASLQMVLSKSVTLPHTGEKKEKNIKADIGSPSFAIVEQFLNFLDQAVVQLN